MMDFIKKLYDANLLNTELIVGVLSFLGGLLVSIVAIIPVIKKNRSEEKDKQQSKSEKVRQPVIEQLTANRERAVSKYNKLRENEVFIFELLAFSSDEMIEKYNALDYFPEAPSTLTDISFAEGFELASIGEIRSRVLLYNSLVRQASTVNSKLEDILKELNKICVNVIARFADQEEEYIHEQIEMTRQITDELEEIYSKINDSKEKEAAEKKSKLIYTDFVRGSVRITGHVITAKDIQDYVDDVVSGKEKELEESKKQIEELKKKIYKLHLSDSYTNSDRNIGASTIVKTNLDVLAAACKLVEETNMTSDFARNAAMQQLELLNQNLIRNLESYMK